MHKLEIYVDKEVSKIDGTSTNWFINYQNDKLSWKAKNDEYINRYGSITSGDIIFNGELIWPETVNSEAIRFIKGITPDITAEALELSERYERTSEFIGVSKSEVASYINGIDIASKHLNNFIAQYDKVKKNRAKLQKLWKIN